MASDKAFIDKMLDDAERGKIEQIANDPTMVRAVKKVLLAGIYYNGTLKPGEEPDAMRNFAVNMMTFNLRTNDQLGEEVRGAIEGMIKLEQGFDGIALYKAPPKGKGGVDNSKNPR